MAVEMKPQYIPEEGTGGGKYINRDNYVEPPIPTRPLPDKVEEIEPYAHTYGYWTGDLYQDILTPPVASPEGTHYNHDKAQRVVDFIQGLIQFEGRYSGHKMRLMWWQERLVRYVFGWVVEREDEPCEGDPFGSGCTCPRLVKRVYLEIPRKNGKSMFAAALALVLAYADGEGAPLVAIAAADKEQAGDTYIKSRYMVEYDRTLANRSVIYGPAKKMLIPDTHGEIRTLSSKSGKLFGLNLHGLVFDELMVQRTRELWDALTTAQGAREQPLIIAITTAGWNKQSVAFEQREYARRIHAGDFTDPEFLGVLYTVDEDADWTLEETWKKAAPSLGETVNLKYYQEKCKEAIGQPSAQNSFRTLMLCQWVGQMKRLIIMADWDSDQVPTVNMKDLIGEKCWAGLDMSSTTDLTAFVLDFPDVPHDGYHFQLPYFWLPAEYSGGGGLRDRGLSDMVDYETWEREKLLRIIPGPVIKDEYIRELIREVSELYKIGDIGFDRWGAAQLARELEEDRFTLVRLGQGMATMAAPTKEYLRLVADHKLCTNSNPILRWMADNVAGVMDPAGNVKLDKAESGSRIDGLVAGVMALDGSTRRGGKKRKSVYDNPEHLKAMGWNIQDDEEVAGVGV